MTRFLFRLGVMLIPFTGVAGLSLMGELRSEISAYIFMVSLACFGLSLLSSPHMGRLKIVETETLFHLMAVMFFLILLSFAANFETIRESVFQGRTGTGKFLTSTFLVLYGFSLAFMTYHLAGAERWDDLLLKPMMASVGICAVFSVFEMGARLGAGLDTIYGLLSSVVHSGFPVPEWDTRLRSVAFEPPDFANTAGYIWPWLLGSILTAKGRMRAAFFALWAVLNVMILLSGARTSLIIISGLGAVFLVLRFVFLPPKPQRNPEHFLPIITGLFVLFLPALVLVIGLYFDQIVLAVSTGNSVSNISRLASMVAAFQMFEANPVFGLGFGQFGFHAADFMPPWGYLSWEIELWLSAPLGHWPAVYSVYARFAADMGILGVIMWLGIWLWLARAILIETLLYRKTNNEVPFAAYPLIMSCFAVLLAGVPCDSVRAPMIWINMGLACRYLYEMKKARAALLKTGHAVGASGGA